MNGLVLLEYMYYYIYFSVTFEYASSFFMLHGSVDIYFIAADCVRVGLKYINLFRLEYNPSLAGPSSRPPQLLSHVDVHIAFSSER